jgi:hypothetical protein
LKRWPRTAWPAIALAAAAPFFCIPHLGHVQNYPALRHPELDELASWARANTDKDAVFLFPDAGRALYPGIFRADALRAVYVDWKGGGQINFLREFTGVWWQRWQATMARPYPPGEIDPYADLGIDYAVLQAAGPTLNRQPVYWNARYRVYRIATSAVVP